tara:strand:- start:819 stop:1388 length:570 start_codon:yes stop_codon:yes gene_type:complete
MSTLKVDTILKRTGTGTITVGQSGDTISVPTGATLSVSGSASGLPDNTPAFQVYMSSNQSVSTSTYTKVALANEYYDTDSAYDTSNYRFTVPSGKGGKYLFYFNADFDLGANNSKYGNVLIRVNGSTPTGGGGTVSYGGASNNSGNNTETRTLTLAAGDYVELYCWQNNGSSRNLWNPAVFGGHRLTGV